MHEIKVIIFVISFAISLLACACHYLCSESPENPHSVMATATRTTEDSTTPRPHPRQYQVLQHPTAVPGPRQSYQGVPYQPVPGQPHYPAQPGDPAPCDNPAEPMTTSWNHEQPLQLPPSYQDANGPAYPLQPMPSSQPAYLLNPLAQPQPNALPDNSDFLAHTACSPEFVLR